MTPNLLLVALVTVLLVQGVGALECWSSKVSGEIIDANGFHNADQTVTWGMWAEFIKPNPMGYQQVTCPASVSQCIVIASMPDLSTSYDTSSSAVLMAGCLDPEAPWVRPPSPTREPWAPHCAVCSDATRCSRKLLDAAFPAT